MELSDDGQLELVSTCSLRAHEDILSWIARNRGRGGCVMAVNAPIIVDNTSGRRPCDVMLEEHFGQHHVDDYSVNTVNASHPRTIGRALQRMGFDVNPVSDGDRVVETTIKLPRSCCGKRTDPFVVRSWRAERCCDPVQGNLAEKLFTASPDWTKRQHSMLGIDPAQRQPVGKWKSS